MDAKPNFAEKTPEKLWKRMAKRGADFGLWFTDGFEKELNNFHEALYN